MIQLPVLQGLVDDQSENGAIITKFELKFTNDVLESGECEGKIEVCEDPFCHCSELIVTLFVTRDGSKIEDFTFYLDLERRRYSNRSRFTDSYYKKIAREFVEDIDDKLWGGLQSLFMAVKGELSERYDLPRFSLPSPMMLDDSGSSMYGFREILPHAEPFLFHLDESEQTPCYVTDSYCVEPDCTCREVLLSFYSLAPDAKKKPLSLQTEFFVDYRSGVVGLVRQTTSDERMSPPAKLLGLLTSHYEGLMKRCENRHRLVKKIFNATFEKRKPAKRYERSEAGVKVGRNDACPCGSGKKYKKCCMRGKESGKNI